MSSNNSTLFYIVLWSGPTNTASSSGQQSFKKTGKSSQNGSENSVETKVYEEVQMELTMFSTKKTQERYDVLLKYQKG